MAINCWCGAQGVVLATPQDQLAELQQQARQLQGQLRSQQRQILEQQEALAHLNALIKPQPLHPPTSATLGLQRPPASVVKPPLRPFDAQLAAAGDRRAIGMYDARFHSTNWCARAGWRCPAGSACPSGGEIRSRRGGHAPGAYPPPRRPVLGVYKAGL